jgi:hypothetical protein
MNHNHWLDKWENEQDIKHSLSFYQKALDETINEYISCKRLLKSLEYRITQIKEEIEILNSQR